MKQVVDSGREDDGAEEAEEKTLPPLGDAHSSSVAQSSNFADTADSEDASAALTPLPIDEPLTPLPHDTSNGFDSPRGNNQASAKNLSGWALADSGEGNRLGVYRLSRELGEWRFGKLFEAEHMHLQRQVRLITLEAPWRESVAIREWFLTSSRSIAGVNEPTISSAVLEYVELGEDIFIVIPPKVHFKSNLFKEYVQRAELGSRYEMVSHGFYLLVNALRVFHEQGLIHSSIDTCHIVAGERTDRMLFDPFATGIPEADLVNEKGEVKATPEQTMRADYRQLARAFIAMLCDLQTTAIPQKISARWVRSRLPFTPYSLARQLSKFASYGIDPEQARDELDKLNVMRQEPLVRMSKAERLSNVIPFGLYTLIAVLLAIPIIFFFSPGAGLDTLKTIVFSTSIGFILLNSAVEVVFGSSLLRWRNDQFIINHLGVIPNATHRLARVFAYLTSLFTISAILSGFVFGSTLQIAAWLEMDHTSLSLGLRSYFVLMLGPAAAIVYLTAWLFKGQPLHDWLLRTSCVHYRIGQDGPTISLSTSVKCNKQSAEGQRQAVLQGVAWERVDSYAIESLLGSGGMGVVYKGFDETLERPVALKVITSASADVEDIVKRFKREARLASILNHPNIAKVYRVGVWQNSPYMAMEFVDGVNLQDLVKKEGPLPLARAWEIIKQAATGLQEAAGHGIIHRDIKPANLMLTNDGVVKVMDFGISKFITSEEAKKQPPIQQQISVNEQIASEPVDTTLTHAGSIMGTPQYMSPEQAKSERLDNRSDIYSLGLTLYYLLAGRAAFESAGVFDLLIKQCMESHPPLPAKILNDSQHQVLERMLAKSKVDRFQDYVELIDALTFSQPEEPRLPSTSRRFAAMFIDFVAISLVQSLILVCLAGISVLFSKEFSLLDQINTGLFAILSFASVLCYYAGATVWLRGTLGQRALELVVVANDGEKVRWRDAVIRWAAKYPIMALAVVLALPVFFWLPDTFRYFWISPWTPYGLLIFWIASYIVVRINLTTNRKALHDLLGGTRVVFIPRQRRRRLKVASN